MQRCRSVWRDQFSFAQVSATQVTMGFARLFQFHHDRRNWNRVAKIFFSLARGKDGLVELFCLRCDSLKIFFQASALLLIALLGRSQHNGAHVRRQVSRRTSLGTAGRVKTETLDVCAGTLVAVTK